MASLVLLGRRSAEKVRAPGISRELQSQKTVGASGNRGGTVSVARLLRCYRRPGEGASWFGNRKALAVAV